MRSWKEVRKTRAERNDESISMEQFALQKNIDWRWTNERKAKKKNVGENCDDGAKIIGTNADNLFILFGVCLCICAQANAKESTTEIDCDFTNESILRNWKIEKSKNREPQWFENEYPRDNMTLNPTAIASSFLRLGCSLLALDSVRFICCGETNAMEKFLFLFFYFAYRVFSLLLHVSSLSALFFLADF